MIFFLRVNIKEVTFFFFRGISLEERGIKHTLNNILVFVLVCNFGCILTGCRYCSSKCQNKQHQSFHRVFGFLSSLSPDPRPAVLIPNSTPRDLTKVSLPSLRRAWTSITIKFLLPSDITGSLQIGTSPFLGRVSRVLLASVVFGKTVAFIHNFYHW